jgi:hypothetical protein
MLKMIDANNSEQKKRINISEYERVYVCEKQAPTTLNLPRHESESSPDAAAHNKRK